jgi:hypothetical protein
VWVRAGAEVQNLVLWVARYLLDARGKTWPQCSRAAVMEVVGLAEQHGGEYNGWGCKVVSADECLLE